jgi:hypothetical protein
MKKSNNLTKKIRKTNKYVFTLKNVNTEKIDQKFNISLISNLSSSSQPLNTTKLADLNNNDVSMDIISFLDETKRNYQCNATMIDFSTNENIEYKKYNCFWCRHQFDTIPIGCPIKYVSRNACKKYFSEISRDNYVIKEKLSKYRSSLLHDKKEEDIFIKINKSEYYETDGIFCSFNCCKAFIKDNKHNSLYDMSENLLTKLYFDMYIGNENIKKPDNKFDSKNLIFIESAPHWRLLKKYGGYLTIEQFRENFNKILYEYHGIINPESFFKPVAFIFEEKIKF